MSHRKQGKHRAALDKAEELAAQVGPAPGPKSPRRGAGEMWNPATNPVQVHAPKNTDKEK